MGVIFDPSGLLDVASDPSDLPQSGDGSDISSDALTRCKNLRISQRGIAKTRDGSAKLNDTAIETDVWWIEEQAGLRYAFAGDSIYEDESSIETGLTSAQWSAVQYNAFNDTTQQIFALNGTDRKRISDSEVNEWGADAPEDEPELAAGNGTGLTGRYNARYTYLRKVGATVVYESNPSPPASNYVQLTNQSLEVTVTPPTDPQITHIRLYRTTADGTLFYWDQEIPVSTFSYGFTHSFEEGDAYLSGDGYQFTYEDAQHNSENTYTWEAVAETTQISDGGSGGNAWYETGNNGGSGPSDYELQLAWLNWYMNQV